MRTLLAAAAIALVLVPRVTCAATPAPDARVLLTRYKCYLCHADVATKAGPAYRDVANAYRGRRGALRHLAAVIRNGQHGGGPWHMPPHPEVSARDARIMARYILSLPD